MSNYLVSDTDLTSVANAIRTKGGTSAQLEFPTDFVSAIGAIPSGGGGAVIKTGTVTVASNSNTLTFPCDVYPKAVQVFATVDGSYDTRHCNGFYFHEAYCGYVRGRNANSSSNTNFSAAIGTQYEVGEAFGTYYKVDWDEENEECTLTCRNGYGFITNCSPYSYNVLSY